MKHLTGELVEHRPRVRAAFARLMDLHAGESVAIIRGSLRPRTRG